MGTVLGQAAAPSVARRRAGGSPLVVAVGVLVTVLLAAPVVGAVVAGSAVFEGVVARLLLFSYVLALSFAVTAVLVARHQPGNRLAPLMAAIALGFGAATLCERYAVLGFERGWPAVEWVLWVGQWIFAPAMWAIPTLVVALFPAGRLPSARWRPFVVLTAIAMLVGTTGWALAPYGEADTKPAVPLENPVASDAGVPLFALGTGLWAVAVAIALGGLARRVATARGALRAQLLWLLLGIAGTIVAAVAGGVTSNEALPTIGVALLPAGIAVGVVRHGLWDVRVIVARSLVYGVLVAAIVAVYAATVGLLGELLGREVGAPLLATGLVAVGVQPARDRLQRLASHLLYGDREDPYAAISRLGAQLDAVVDRGSLLATVTDSLVRTMRLRGAAVTDGDDVLASVGDVGAAPERLELTVAGERVGTLVVGLRDGDDLTPADRRLLADLARHVSAVVQAERLQAALAASRARLVTAREEERRRIRRDLHDELGPTLAAIANEVERAGLDVHDDPGAASARLDDVAERVRAAVRDVRALVEGLRPAALDQLGLEGAVRELVRRLGGSVVIRVTTHGDLAGLPAAVEVGAYRIVAEALTNVVRHAGATTCEVTLRRSADHLEVTVGDDGRGIAPSATPGVGRPSMAERAGELGGALTVDTGRSGTRVRATLPVREP